MDLPVNSVKLGTMRLPTLIALRRHPLILPLYVPAFLIAVAEGVQEVALPLYLLDFDISYGLIGFVLAAQALSMVIFDAPSGLVLARLGSKKTMWTGLLTMALSSLALVWAATLPGVLLCRIAFGFGMSVYAIARHAYIAEFTPNAGRGRSVAVIGGVFRGGRLIGPVAAGLIASIYDLRAPFAAMALVISGALLIVVLFVPATRGNRQARAGSFVRGLAATARRYWRVFGSIGVGQLLVQMVRQGRSTILPLYAAEVLNLDEAAIGVVVSTGAALDTLFFLPAGFIMDTLGRKWAIVPSFIIQGIGLALIPLTSTFAALTAAAALIGLGNGLSAGTMLTLGADLAPQEGRGEFLGLWRTLGSAGFSVGPLAVGGVADLLTLSAAAVVLGICGFAASGLFAYFVPETLRRPPP